MWLRKKIERKKIKNRFKVNKKSYIIFWKVLYKKIKKYV